MSTRLLRCRTRWRPRERQAFIAATASEARIAATAPRSLRVATGRRKRTATRHCVAARGGARGSAQSAFVRRRRGENGCDGDVAALFAHAVAPVGAPSAAAAGLYGEWRVYSLPCCCAEKRRFRKDQVTRRNSVARRTTFKNRRLAAELGSQMAWSVTTGVVS
jgi:hypothetical protein